MQQDTSNLQRKVNEGKAQIFKEHAADNRGCNSRVKQHDVKVHKPTTAKIKTGISTSSKCTKLRPKYLLFEHDYLEQVISESAQ